MSIRQLPSGQWQVRWWERMNDVLAAALATAKKTREDGMTQLRADELVAFRRFVELGHVPPSFQTVISRSGPAHAPLVHFRAIHQPSGLAAESDVHVGLSLPAKIQAASRLIDVLAAALKAAKERTSA